MKVTARKGAEISSDLSRPDLAQVPKELDVLGTDAERVLKFMQGLAQAIEQLGLATAELKLAVNVDGDLTRLSGELKFTQEVFSQSTPQDETTQQGALATSIKGIGLSWRARGACIRAGADTVADVTGVSENRLRTIRNVGDKTIREIRSKLEEFGVKLKGD